MARKRKLKKNQSHQLNIDLAADLFLKIKGVKGFFPSYLIGMKPEAFLIIKSPTILSSENLISEGTSLMVRYKHLGDIYRFGATILGTNEEPYKVTYLSYPDVVERIEYRNSTRINSYIPASLSYKDSEVKGIVTDISVAGCKFRTSSIEQLEDLLNKKEGDVTLHFPVLGLDGIRKFKGRIKKVTFDNDLALGIGFSKVDEEYQKVITSWVESTKEYRTK